ncbi:MAG: glycosyltransferase family 39 protein [Coleofasciculus sp. D1-CHI-01]|uniref:ArnT family glycosyltransferase n=1 Tax=Coleofasciculus sp. D1-CHI-01 TaxID=3068482 RepID=UPI0032FABCEB
MQEKNQSKDLTIIYLLIILAVAALLRLLFLGTIPNGFFCDEASNAYDSYSMLKTLRDQHGTFLPLFSRALDDYRETLYAFITIPFIKIFGLNEFAARFPAALIGVLTVLVIYHLVKECFDRQTGLFSALLLAINPWHIQFSRIAFRAILIPLLFSLGFLFFVKSFRKNNYLPLSGLIFGLSLYTYSSARVFVPLFLMGLLVIYWRHLWENRKQTLIALVLFLLSFIPLFSFWISPEGMARATGSAATGLTFNPGTVLRYYLSYFSPDFLFFSGDPIPRHSPAKIGQLYYFEIVTVIVGLFYLLREHHPVKPILLLWLFLLTEKGYKWKEVYAVKDFRGIEYLKLIKLSKGQVKT